MTEKRGSWATCMTDLRIMPHKHDKHAFFQTQIFLQLISWSFLSSARNSRPGIRSNCGLTSCTSRGSEIARIRWIIGRIARSLSCRTRNRSESLVCHARCTTENKKKPIPVLCEGARVSWAQNMERKREEEPSDVILELLLLHNDRRGLLLRIIDSSFSML